MAEPNTTYESKTPPTGSSSANGPDRNGEGFIHRIRERASARIETQKDRAVDGLDSVAQAVRDSTRQLRSQQHDTVARYVEQAADEIERIAHRLRDKEVRDFLVDLQQLARRQPAAFIGSAFVVGLIAGRFFRSSSEAERFAAERDSAYGQAYASAAHGYSTGVYPDVHETSGGPQRPAGGRR